MTRATPDNRPERVDGLTHAGGIVCARREDGPLFLLARASRPPFHWVLPKGHIEAGETAEQTARREVLEESGVDAEIVRPVGDIAFAVDGRYVRVRYFLMRFRTQSDGVEGRDIRWCSPAEAERLLPFESTRDLVRLAAQDPG